MAESKRKSAGVEHVTNEDGSQSIGVKVGGYFVPFVTLSGARVEQLRENAEQRGQSSDDDEEGGEK